MEDGGRARKRRDTSRGDTCQAGTTRDEEDEEQDEEGDDILVDNPYKRFRFSPIPSIPMCTPARPPPGPPGPPAPPSAPLSGPLSGPRMRSSASVPHSSTEDSALAPDQIYPCLDVYPHSGHRPSLPQGLLQSRGKLKLSIYMNHGLMTVHVMEACHLCNSSRTPINSFVQLTLIPNTGCAPICCTDIVRGSSQPVYNHKTSLEVQEADANKRLLVSVWHHPMSEGELEFLGCMSFSIGRLLRSKEVGGWYHLLAEKVGSRKHQMVTPQDQDRTPLTERGSTNAIPAINKDVLHLQAIEMQLTRAKHGFGFTLMDDLPVRVARVEKDSPAEKAGMQVGDCVIWVNGRNVSRSTRKSVAELIRQSAKLVLTVHRKRNHPLYALDQMSWQTSPSAVYESIPDLPSRARDGGNSGLLQLDSISDKENSYVEMKNPVVPRHPTPELEESTYVSLLSRLPRPASRSTGELGRQEAVHGLLSLEVDFVAAMEAGTQRYTRPLRHCILTGQQHLRLFQNVVKLVSISEYHLKQMKDILPTARSSDESTSSDASPFQTGVGLIYHPAIETLCQAYEMYATGLGAANQVLSDLQSDAEFCKFIERVQGDGCSLSISEFLTLPVMHIKQLAKAFSSVLARTPPSSPDHSKLVAVVDALQFTSTTIQGLGIQDVQSFGSVQRRGRGYHGSGSSASSKNSGSEHGASRPPSPPPSCKSSSSKLSELQRLQDRLIFPPHVPVFNVVEEGRELVYQSEIFKVTGQQWAKVYFLLLSDMLVQVEVQRDGGYKVLESPIPLSSITAVEVNSRHRTEMVVHICRPNSSSARGADYASLSLGMYQIVVRTPSTKEFVIWKRHLERRLGEVQENSRSPDSMERSGSFETII